MYAKAIKALSEYITMVRPQMIAMPDEQALFVNINGERMSRQGFWKIIKYYQKKANIEKELNKSMADCNLSGINETKILDVFTL